MLKKKQKWNFRRGNICYMNFLKMLAGIKSNLNITKTIISELVAVRIMQMKNRE